MNGTVDNEGTPAPLETEVAPPPFEEPPAVEGGTLKEEGNLEGPEG